MGDVRKIVIALLLGIALGALTPEVAPGPVASFLMGTYGFLGTLFLNALKMVIVPLITTSIISGVAGVGGTRSLGTMGIRTFFYYMVTSLLAVLTGVFLVNIVSPGVIDGAPLAQALGLNGLGEAGGATLEKVRGADFGAILNIFYDMVPPNVVQAAVEGQMLGIISFSILFGVFIPRIGYDYSEVLFRVIQGVHEVMMAITEFIMRFAPIGIFALVAKVVAEAGAGDLLGLAKGLGLFCLTVVTGLMIHTFVTLFFALLKVGHRNPVDHFRAMVPALVTAFSTASSAATLPITMECLERRARVRESVTGFVIPLGATVNMDGTALYECVSALFIAQALGVETSLVDQVVVVWIALISSIGVAGIPAASLVAIAIILKAVGLPVEAMAIILPVDRFLDMLRTAVNVFSDSVGAVIVDELETSRGET